MKNNIKIGYEVGTGKLVNISPSHLIVTGVTQLSGKTTTMEALIKRSGLKAIVFKTKIGEKSFTEGTEIPPFFRDRSDYEFVKSLIEAYSREKLSFEKGTLMTLSKGSASLIDIKKRVDDKLAENKLRGLKEEIYVRLQHYLENIIPQIQYANFSKTLMIYEGINIMNLERFSEEAQSLIIQSVADEVLKTMNGIILVIPEAWKFLPQKYNNPCKRVVESFIRQGATNNNFIWIDSQDMAGVDKLPLKQISTWILGYQSERNEVKHTLDQIALPKKSKPAEDEIMNLKKGHFIVSDYEGVKRIYVQPAWLTDELAIAVAKGNKRVEDLAAPNSLTPLSIASKQSDKGSVEIRFDDSQIRKQMVELRQDFFNKIEELQTSLHKVYEEIYSLKSNMPHIDLNEVVSLVLQKLPSSNNSTINKDALIKEILAKVPQSTGNVTYAIAPLEKIKKDFLEEAKNKIVSDVRDCSVDSKKVLKYIEAAGRDVSPSELIMKCLLLKQGGAQSVKMSNLLKELLSIECVVKTAGGRYGAGLKERIKFLMANHSATEEEMNQVYDHILSEV